MKIIQTLHIVHIQITKHLIGRQCHGGGQIKVCGICRYFYIIGKLQLLLVDLQVLLQSGKSESYYDGMASIVDDLSVVYLNIREVFIVEDHAGQHYEGNVNLFLFTINRYSLFLLVGIGKAHGHLTAFSGKLLRFDFLTVQHVSYLYIYRKLLFQRFLAVGICSACMVLQPVTCHDFCGISVGIGDHINGLVFG